MVWYSLVGAVTLVLNAQPTGAIYIPQGEVAFMNVRAHYQALQALEGKHVG